MVEGGWDKICCQTSLTKEHNWLFYAHQFDLVRPGKKMFCFKRSLSEKFTCVEVIDRSLARNISPVFRCALPRWPIPLLSTTACVCVSPLRTISVFHRPVFVFYLSAPLLCSTDLGLCTTSVFHRPLPVFVFHPCAPLLCSTDLCLCFTSVYVPSTAIVRGAPAITQFPTNG